MTQDLKKAPNFNGNTPQELQKALKHFASYKQMKVTPLASYISSPSKHSSWKARAQHSHCSATFLSRKVHSHKIRRKSDGFASKKHLHPFPQQDAAIPVLTNHPPHCLQQGFPPREDQESQGHSALRQSQHGTRSERKDNRSLCSLSAAFIPLSTVELN